MRQPRTLKELSLYCFSNPATSLTHNSIKRTFDFKSVHTAGNYVHYLEEAYLILLARPFAFKFREQVRQARKVYAVDNGLTRALTTKVSQDRGALLENLVFQGLGAFGEVVYNLRGLGQARDGCEGVRRTLQSGEGDALQRARPPDARRSGALGTMDSFGSRGPRRSHLEVGPRNVGAAECLELRASFSSPNPDQSLSLPPRCCG